MTIGLEAACLRTLAWFMAMGYPPLLEELVADFSVGGGQAIPSRTEVERMFEQLEGDAQLIARHRRFVLPGYEGLFAEQTKRERSFPRKWRKIQRLVRWIRLLPSVRFVAVCNTTALGSARDEADIDLFLIVHEGTLWLTRGLLSLFAAVTFRRPNQRRGERDALCFSFFIDDADLSLQKFSLEPDPYLSFWTRRLLPVLDDGIGQELWEAQAWAVAHQPFALRWLSWKTISSREKPVWRWLAWLDGKALALQRRLGSKALWGAADKEGTEVVLNAHTFKAHLDDRRATFRDTYEALCERLEISAY